MIDEYICKIATAEDMEQNWNYLIEIHTDNNAWKIWKEKAIKDMENENAIVYYGILNGVIISEATAFLSNLDAQNSDGLVDDTTAYLSAFRTREKIFSKELDVYSHVKILLSKMEDGNIWLHTRGLRKFGRPDVSIENIHESDVDKAVRVANQMIYYSSLGVLFNKKTKLHTHKEETFIVNPKFIEDYENIDFNNAYCKLLWEECEQVI